MNQLVDQRGDLIAIGSWVWFQQTLVDSPTAPHTLAIGQIKRIYQSKYIDPVVSLQDCSDSPFLNLRRSSTVITASQSEVTQWILLH